MLKHSACVYTPGGSLKTIKDMVYTPTGGSSTINVTVYALFGGSPETTVNPLKYFFLDI